MAKKLIGTAMNIRTMDKLRVIKRQIERGSYNGALLSINELLEAHEAHANKIWQEKREKLNRKRAERTAAKLRAAGEEV